MGFYQSYLGPRIISWSCGHKVFQRLRQVVVPRAGGRVLEIGIGSGHNLPFYDPGRVDALWGLEPNPIMRDLAGRNLEGTSLDVNWLDLPGEKIPLSDGSIDCVVSTFTMCSIPDLPAALAEVRRVLRPEGQLLFLEHGLDPSEGVQRWQRRLEPAWSKIGLGCRLTRHIPAVIESEGFQVSNLESGYMRGSERWPKALRACGVYGYWGAAVTPPAHRRIHNN